MTQAVPGRARRFVALGLSIAFVLGALLSGVFVYRTSHLTDKPFSFKNDGQVVPSEREQARVKAVGEQFALRMDSLDSKDLAGYIKSVSDMLTTKCKSDFEKVGPGIAPSIGKIAFTTKGYLRSSGIVTMDRDSATVMVVHDALKTASTGDSIPTALRWTIALRKVNGNWLVDSFNDPDNGSPCEGVS